MVTYIYEKDNAIKFENHAKHEALEYVIAALERRYDSMGFAGMKRQQAQCEGLMGAIAMLDALAKDPVQSQITPKIYFSILRGDYVHVDDDAVKPEPVEPEEFEEALPKDEITFTKTVTIEQLSNILVTALEGGINYWCDQARRDIKCEGVLSDIWKTHPEAGIILANEYETRSLTKENLLKGIATAYKNGDVDEDEVDEVDANGADIFVQYAIFGEIIFG